MACDNFLLESLVQEKLDLPLLRLYSWDKPTYSIGANQKLQNKINGFPFVKRITGGQAVLHGTLEDELTYSVVLNKTFSFKQIYQDIGNVLISFLKELGLKASIGYSSDSYRDDFDCFTSQTPADIVVNDTKIIGSAQYRKGKCILQHGSIRLDKIQYFSKEIFSFEETENRLKISFENKLNVNFIKYELVQSDVEKIKGYNVSYVNSNI